MNNVLSELNAQYRCEYEEANNRLQNTTKLLTSLLVAIIGILTAAVAAFIPACTCNNYNVKPCELVLFIMNALSAIVAFGIDLFGLMPLSSDERLFMSSGQVEFDSSNTILRNRKSRDYKMNYNSEVNEDGDLDLREYYSKKTEKANEINHGKQKKLLVALIITLFAIFTLAGLIAVCIINLASYHV